MTSDSNKYLLNLKKASIQMAIAGNYNVDEDKPVLAYKTGDLEEYFEYAKSTADTNAIRKAYDEKDQLTNRASLSTLYESKDRPNHFILMCFIPVPNKKFNKSISKDIITIGVSLCRDYLPQNQRYCSSCDEKQNKIKRCSKCPAQKYCKNCEENLKCTECPENSFCPACSTKLKKMNVYKLAREKCINCTQTEYCESCSNLRNAQECKECSQFATQEEKDKCNNCITKLKCKECPSFLEKGKKGKNFCEDCENKMNFHRCKDCPFITFCNSCTKINNIKPCLKCPPPPQIIERCVIISEIDLSPEAKQVASANIPRIKPSTGDEIEVGCLIQVYLDKELLYNPLIHSLGSRYQVMSIEETIDFFQNPENNVTEYQIPQIDMAGPVCQYLGLYPGRLLRIERTILVPGSMIQYEIVYRLVRLIPIVRKNRRRNLKKTATNITSAVEDEL